MTTLAPVALPPAVFARAPAPHLSDRYVHIDTNAVLDAFKQEGYVVAGTMEQRARNVSRTNSEFRRHVIDLRHPSLPQVGGAVPRFLFGNSHDGSMRATVLLGVFRLACSNGLVVGAQYANAKIIHAGEAARNVIERLRDVARSSTPLFQQIETWQRRQLTAAQREEFAQLASTLRWGDPYRFSPQELLAVRRQEDDAGDLWTTFNRVQEATTNLSLPGLARSGRTTTSKPLTQIDANLRYNRDLWELAAEFA